MCGIAGVISLNGRPIEQPDVVRLMMDRLVHRGPDEEGVYRNPAGTVVLGHRRLRIIDLSSGRQPLGNEDGSVMVAFNGEIYGFQPLADELRRRGHRFSTRTDTEVIVHLYEEEGLRSLARLSGMFAIALWDERAGTLLLARDRAGKKPLYYVSDGGALWFASELDALTAVPAVSRQIDEEALDLYLTLGYIPAPWTIYRNVRKLQAGHAVQVRQGQAVSDLEQVPYGMTAASGEDDASHLTWAEAKAELLRRLRAATAVRMVSDVPLGCFLSGGVDSSAVLSCMAELSSQPVKTFSIGFPEEEFSELAHARLAARHFGTDHHEYVLEPEGVGVLDELVRHFGEPFADSSALPTWYLSKLTRKSVTVALTGDGGDELFAGYNWYRTGERLASAARLIPRPAARVLAALRELEAPRILKRAGKAASLLALSDGMRYARQREAMTPDVKAALYAPEFLARARDKALEWLARQYETASPDAPLNRMTAADLASYMAEDLLVKVDRTSMAHALECRSPLLDTDLVRWAVTVPPRFKLSRYEGKRLLREAVRDRFPAGFLDRRKQGFTVPLERWFAGDLQGVVRDRVLHGPLFEMGYFRGDGLRRVVMEHLDGKANHTALVWALLVLASWHERYAV